MSEGGVVPHCAFGVSSVVVTVTELLARFGSGVDEETDAMFVIEPPPCVALIVIATIEEPGESDVARQVTTPFAVVQFQPVPPAETTVAPLGSVSLSAAFTAPAGPRFVMVKVQVSGAPGATLLAEVATESERSALPPIAIDLVPVALQPFVVTVTPSVTLPPAPAVKVIWFVAAPPVIVPPEIVQLYVVPAGPALIDAMLPVDDAATLFGALIVTVAELPIGMATLPVDVQPLAETVTPSCTVPEAFAVKVIEFEAVVMIVPPVIDHE
jgi:hypothetical protein